MNPRYTLIHLHFDIEKHLEPLLRRWNERRTFLNLLGIARDESWNRAFSILGQFQMMKPLK